MTGVEPVAPATGRTLVVTNDFPPRTGGIQTFVGELARRRPPDSVVVLHLAAGRGAAEFDRTLPFPVVRHRASVMLPTPTVARHAIDLLASYELRLGALRCGRAARRARARGCGVPARQRLVALTHGHEAGWAGMPGGSPLLRRIGDGVDVVTYLGAYTRSRIAPALSPAAAARMAQLAPGVDAARVHARRSTGRRSGPGTG